MIEHVGTLIVGEGSVALIPPPNSGRAIQNFKPPAQKEGSLPLTAIHKRKCFGVLKILTRAGESIGFCIENAGALDWVVIGDIVPPTHLLESLSCLGKGGVTHG